MSKSIRFRNTGAIVTRVLCALIAFAMILAAAAFGEESVLVLNSSGMLNRWASVDPTDLSEGFSAVLYNNLSGLPTSDANTIAETQEGFIWIGSYAGLIRYDGNMFERMDSTNGITSVMCLYVDRKNRLWIGTNANGLAVMERGQFQFWNKLDGLKSSSVRAITEDANGVMYIASTSGINFVNPDMRMESLDDPRLEGTYVWDIRIGADGLIYGVTSVGDIFTMQDKEIVTFVSAADCPVKGVNAVLPDPLRPGYLYMGTETEDTDVYHGKLEGGITMLDVKSIAPLSCVERFEYINGKVWICADNGIGNIDDQGFHQLTNVPMNNSVRHVMTDYEGNLWFTSTRQGIMKIVPNQFSDIYARAKLPEAVVNTTCLFNQQLFIGTDSGLTVIEDDARVDSLPLTKAVTASGVNLETDDLIQYLDGVRIRSIIRDSQNRLWIATWRSCGLLRYDNGELMAFTTDDGLMSDRIRVTCERPDGSIVVTNTGGVSIIEGDRITGRYSTEDGIENNEILTVAEGMNGDLILGSDGGGIYIVGKNGTRHIGVDDGLGSEVIMRVKRDHRRDVFWIVTTNSLAYMDADYNVTTIKNFPYPNNFDVYENDSDDVWVLSGNGIYVLPAEELLANGELSPVFYNHNNGFNDTATSNSYSELTDDGVLYIAGTSGVVKVNIKEPFENLDKLKAAVPYVEADGKRIYPDERGTFFIPKETHKITIYSFVFNYSLVNPQVTDWLEGFDTQMDTVRRSELAPMVYTNLRGGDYEFKLQVSDALGRGNKEISVRIVKEKKLYEKTWFIILMGLVLLSALAVIVRLYVRSKTNKLEKRQKETMALIGEITEAFAKVIDMKDKYTNGHSTRVAKYTAMLSKELGCDDETVEKYYRIALLHDIGKIGVPPEVLNKPGKLTDEEFDIIKSHALHGGETLKGISIMPELAIGAEAHHERPDGRGYPNHLKGDEIPRVAQIIAVADCFDAMYSNRPYRSRMNFDRVVSIIKEVSGTQLASDVVEAFLRLVDKGEFRDPNDEGGGSVENIENIRNGKG